MPLTEFYINNLISNLNNKTSRLASKHSPLFDKTQIRPVGEQQLIVPRLKNLLSS